MRVWLRGKDQLTIILLVFFVFHFVHVLHDIRKLDLYPIDALVWVTSVMLLYPLQANIKLVDVTPSFSGGSSQKFYLSSASSIHKETSKLRLRAMTATTTAHPSMSS
jgi:hypothetical protein